MILPAITIWQPWASLIVAGCKPFEFRGWPAPRSYRGKRIAIHAGARPIRRAEVQQLITQLLKEGAVGTALDPLPSLELLGRALTSPGAFPISHVLCTAVLGEPVRATALVPAGLADSDRADHSKWAWPLDDIVPMEQPVPARGAQGFWSWAAEGIAA